MTGLGLLVALLTAVSYLGFVAKENHDRADRWRDRSTATQDLLDGRTAALNRQTARLNLASTRLRTARLAIVRSEQDVKELSARQRALAAEKAAVEDQRADLEIQGAALVDVAVKLSSCRDSLGGLVSVFAQGFAPTDADFQAAISSCEAADSAIGAFNASYGQ